MSAYPFDLFNKVSSKTTILPQDGVAGVTGTTVDLSGYDGVMISVKIGALGDPDNTGTFTVEESTNDSSWTTVAASDLSSALPAINNTNKNAAYIRRYTGIKRYLRVNCSAITGTTAAGFVQVDILRGCSGRAPVTQG